MTANKKAGTFAPRNDGKNGMTANKKAGTL
jgi:hypothetical protein